MGRQWQEFYADITKHRYGDCLAIVDIESHAFSVVIDRAERRAVAGNTAKAGGPDCAPRPGYPPTRGFGTETVNNIPRATSPE